MDPVLLRPEPEPSQEATEKPWYRLPSEPAQWYQRFRNFAQMGRKRSLAAAYQMEAEAEQALAGTESEKSDSEAGLRNLPPNATRAREILQAPGSWKRASIRWHWVERAQAWDGWRREEQQRQALACVYDEAYFASRAQRVIALSTMAKSLRWALEEETAKYAVQLNETHRVSGFLACIKALQLLLRDIRKEMNELDKAW